MKRFTGFLRSLRIALPDWSVPLILLGLSLVTYGVLIPWLGLYSDDWVFLSTYQKMGRAGLLRYFTTNRPFWGLFFQVTLPWLGIKPWHWHVFGLFWHWTAGLSLWWLVRLTWPKRRETALLAGMAFIVYPGFILQPIALTVGHMFLVYTSFILSVACLVKAQQQRRFFWPYSGLALFFSAINLLSMEYFLLLHFIQPVLLWLSLAEQQPDGRQRLKLVVRRWLPYFFLLVLVLSWRIFFFPYQTHNYQYLFLERLKQNPLAALGYLGLTAVVDWLETALLVWWNALREPFLQGWTTTNLLISLVIASVFGASALLLLAVGNPRSNDTDAGLEKSGKRWKPGLESRQMLATGFLALVIAGAPFWLTEIQVGLTGFASRFTLPFMLGAVLLLCGLEALSPLPRWANVLWAALLIGVGVGQQFQAQNFFRREWIVQKDIYWQLAWRIPELAPGTAVFSNEFPLYYNASDFTQSAMFDWTWQTRPSPQRMDYALYYPHEQLSFGRLPEMIPNQDFRIDHLGSVFNGNTSQSVAVQLYRYEDLTMGCLHVMSPEIDRHNPFYAIGDRKAIPLSNPDLILATSPGQTRQLIPEIFGAEPPPGKCYYFQKADLAYQQRYWKRVIAYFQQAKAAGVDHWEQTELVPFIGAFARDGQWEKAEDLTEEMEKKSHLYPLDKVICRLWQNLSQTTADSPEKLRAVAAVAVEFSCQP